MRWPWQRQRLAAPTGRTAAHELLRRSQQKLDRSQRRLDETRQEARTADLLAEQVRHALGIRP